MSLPNMPEVWFQSFSITFIWNKSGPWAVLLQLASDSSFSDEKASIIQRLRIKDLAR